MYLLKRLYIWLSNHNRYKSIAVICIAALLVWMSACQPRAHSLLDPNRTITRTELEGEVALIQSRIDREIESLEEQEAIRNLLLNLARAYVATGTFDLMSAITMALALFGTGAVVDSVRMRREIKKLTMKE